MKCPGSFFVTVKMLFCRCADFARMCVVAATLLNKASVRLEARCIIKHPAGIRDKAKRYARLYSKSSKPTHCARRPASARAELLAWAKARDFRNRATEYLNGARVASDSNVQRRFVDIAQHYRLLAEAEVSSADRMGAERREQSGTSQLDGSAELQTLRLKLRRFASQQTDQTVRSQCQAVDTKLAEVVHGDDPILRQVLANSVEQLEEAMRRSTMKKATAT